MPPKAAVAAGAEGASSMVLNGIQLTPAESRIAAAVLELVASKLDVDWNEVSEKTEKTAKLCRDTWRVIKIKTGLNGDAAAGSGTPASAKKAAGGAAGSDPGVTPIKRGRGRPPKNAKALMLTPGNGGDQDSPLATPGTAMGNMSLGDMADMTPETPSKTMSGTKRTASEAADPDAIIFDETPAKKKPAPRKRLTAAQKRELAAQKAEMAAAEKAEAKAAEKALATPVEESVDGVATPGFEPASSPIGGSGDNIDVAMDGPSEVEQAIGEILGIDASEAADLVGGIDPGEI